MTDFDLVVIGSGPAGKKGAVQAALMGKRVAAVEREPVLGGAAANTGTLPSKTLRETALHLSGFRQRGLYGVDVSLKHEATVTDFLYRERQVKHIERERIARSLAENGVEVVRGTARLLDAHTVAVEREGQPALQLRARTLLLATGSHPFRPHPYAFESPRIHDSDEILCLDAMPRALVVVGGGVIGCEYACMFATLGVPVVLIERKERILPFLDQEIGDLLVSRMQALGIRLIAGQEVTCADAPEDRAKPVVLTLEDGERLETDMVLVASGRTANSSGLGLEALGVKVGKRGQVEVNAHYQTAVPHLYAVGDVIGFPALASTSQEQARIEMTHAFGQGATYALSRILPYGIYTIPEVSTAGETEETLKEKGIAYVVGRAPFAINPRGQIIGETHGLLKLLFRKEDAQVLGVHILGEQASELVHVGLLAILQGAGARLFLETCFNYPTLSEAYQDATLDALRNGLTVRA